jgi:hypothetical protein
MNKQAPTNFEEDDPAESLSPETDGGDALDGGILFDADEVCEGRNWAMLVYAGNFLLLPLAAVPLVRRDNDYSLYHAKTAGVLWAGMTAVFTLGSLLMPLCGLGLLVWLAGLAPLGVLNFLGLLQAVNEEAKPLPLLEEYPAQWIRVRKQTPRE